MDLIGMEVEYVHPSVKRTRLHAQWAQRLVRDYIEGFGMIGRDSEDIGDKVMDNKGFLLLF